MSDPFGSDGAAPPDPFDPYRRPPAESFHANPYFSDGGRTLDGIAVAALVCALTCCAAPVAIGLGIAGIVRTRDERRSGRWMAVTGLVLGAFLTLGLAAGATGLVLLEQRTYFFEDARPGDCIDMEELDGGSLDVQPADCDEPHDAEVVYAGRFTADLRTSYHESDTFCHPLAKSAGYAAFAGKGELWVDPVIESEEADNPEIGDYFICVAERNDGERLTEALPRSRTDGGGRTDADDRETISSLDLAKGDCFDEPKLDEDDLVSTVTRVPCAQPHDFQVVGNVVLPKGRYPGEESVDDTAGDRCLDEFRDFLAISYDDSRFELSHYTPTAESWRRDRDRTITCLAEHPRGRKLTRDLEGIAR